MCLGDPGRGQARLLLQVSLGTGRLLQPAGGGGGGWSVSLQGGGGGGAQCACVTRAEAMLSLPTPSPSHGVTGPLFHPPPSFRPLPSLPLTCALAPRWCPELHPASPSPPLDGCPAASALGWLPRGRCALDPPSAGGRGRYKWGGGVRGGRRSWVAPSECNTFRVCHLPGGGVMRGQRSRAGTEEGGGRGSQRGAP